VGAARHPGQRGRADDRVTPSRAKLLGEPEARARMLARIPLGRFPTMDEIAAAVCYLASDAAASITGQILVLDGGLTAA
jgi:NAD(P)-dependent dehydrogenase (short-subunit alcohol dehydrogenase family)